MNMLLPAISSIAYLFVPRGTILHFSGTPSPTAEFWCMTVAAGDLLVAYLSYIGFTEGTKNSLVRRIVVRSTFVYTILHMSAFWYAHVFLEPQLNAFVPFYPLSILMVIGQMLAWGIDN